MTDGSDDNSDQYELSINVDVVHARASGSDPEVVAEMFDDVVETAFGRYEEHIEEDGSGRPYE